MKVGIIGAGMAGLSCADFLGRRGIEVAVFDRTSIPGGRCVTEKIDGYNIDAGAQFFFNKDIQTRQLAFRLGLKSSCLPLKKPFGFLKRGRINDFIPSLDSLPRYFWSFFNYDGTSSGEKLQWLRFAAWVKTKGNLSWNGSPKGQMFNGYNVKEVICEKFGKKFCENFISPLVSSWFLKEPQEISAKAGLVFLAALLSGQWVTMGGVGYFSKKVAQKIKKIRLKQEVSKVEADEKSAMMRVGEKEFRFDQIVVATDAVDAANLLKWAPVSKELEKIKYSPAPIVVHALDRRPERIANRYCILAPKKEGRPYVSVVNSSAKFIGNVPPRGTALSWFISGSKGASWIKEPDNLLLERIDHEAKGLFLGYPEPKFTRIIRWKRAMVAPSPGITVNIGTRVNSRLYLAGSYLYSRGVEGAILSGRKAGQAIRETQGR